MRTITKAMLKGLEEALIADERSAGTIEKYIREVSELANWVGERKLCREIIRAWRDELLASGLKPGTVNGKLSSVNALLKYLHREDCRVKSLRVQHSAFRPEEREITKKEYDKLIKICITLGKYRLALILEALCSAGIRVSELAFITVEVLEDMTVIINNKGKLRKIMLPAKLAQDLAEYAAERNIESGPIFITRTGKPIGRKQVWAEMKSICEAAGVDLRKVFPHNLRHLFAVEFYKKTKDIVKLADILGHSSINTTRRYLIGTGAEHRELIESLNLVI